MGCVYVVPYVLAVWAIGDGFDVFADSSLCVLLVVLARMTLFKVSCLELWSIACSMWVSVFPKFPQPRATRCGPELPPYAQPPTQLWMWPAKLAGR